MAPLLGASISATPVSGSDGLSLNNIQPTTCVMTVEARACIIGKRTDFQIN